MEKQTQYAVLAPIQKGVVFSDFCFEDVLYWQYQKDFQADGWLLKLETSVASEHLIEMRLSIGRKTLLAGIQSELDASGREFTTYPGNYRLDEIQIKTDRPEVFLGTLENCLQRKDGRMLHTGKTGMLGDLYVFTNRGEEDPSGFLILATIDGTAVNEEELFAVFCSSFGATEIEREVYEAAIDQTSTSFKLARLEELRTAQAAFKHQS